MMMLLIFVIGAVWFFVLTFKTDKRWAQLISYLLSGICVLLGLTSLWWWK